MCDNPFLLSMQEFYLQIIFITKKKREQWNIFFKLTYIFCIQIHSLEILKFYQSNNTMFL